MIELQHISKTFRVARRNSGFGEAVKALFRREYTEIHALSDVSFRIGDGEWSATSVRTVPEKAAPSKS